MADSFEATSEKRDPRTYAVIGAAMEVHSQLGRGFLEAVYQAALSMEMTMRKLPFEAQVELAIQYKGQALPCKYRADFICYNAVVVEIKALPQLTGVERSQLINYLRATGFRVGLLLNFGADSLEYERIVCG